MSAGLDAATIDEAYASLESKVRDTSVPASAVAALLDDKYAQTHPNAWFGHRSRLTIEGQPVQAPDDDAKPE